MSSQNWELVEFQGCKAAKYIKPKSGRGYYQTCEQCLPCRLRKHNSIIGECLAEAQTSVYVLFLTLTYADVTVGDVSFMPDNAKRPDKTDIDEMLAKLRKKYRLKKAYASEYQKSGRVHWHVLLFFSAEPEADEKYIEAFADHNEPANISVYAKHDAEHYVPKLVMLPVPKDQFKTGLDNPEILLSEWPRWRRQGEGFRNTWKYWPHGLVACEVLWGPFQVDPMGLNNGVAYVCKYITKDPWKGIKANQNKAFEELAPWDKDTTKYGPDEIDEKGKKKAVLGNQYLKDKIEELNIKYGSVEAAPVDERPYKMVHSVKNQPCLGAVYFRAWARRMARLGEDHMGREFQIAGVVKKMTRRQMASVVAKGETRADLRGERLRKFYMKEAAFIWFSKEYISQRKTMKGPPANDRNNAMANILDRRAKQKDRSVNPVLFALWAKADATKRLQYETEWSYLYEKKGWRLPPSLETLFLTTSTLGLWPEIRRRRAKVSKYGETIRSWRLSEDASIVETKLGKFVYVKLLSAGREWWQREIETVEQFQHALEMRLLPPDAKISQLEKEGKGDTRPLTVYTKRQIRNRLNKT